MSVFCMLLPEVQSFQPHRNQGCAFELNGVKLGKCYKMIKSCDKKTTNALFQSTHAHQP